MAIALGISICAFIFRKSALSMISGLFWLITALWALLDAGIVGGIPIGTCCLAMCILMFLSPVFLKEKVPEEVKKSYYEIMAAQIEQMRNQGASFKPQKKDIIL
jgi:CBS domain containing-hemolysin-like protein